VTIEGPYGCIRPLRQFDSVVLLAGSTGATFTLPLLRDIVQGWKENTRSDTANSRLSIFGRQAGAATRHVRFVWVVKSRGQLGWFSEQLSSISTEVHRLQDELRDIKLELTIYVTCDESLTEEHNSLRVPISRADHDTTSRKAVEHGTVQYRGQSVSKDEALVMEKEDIKEPINIATNNAGGTQAVSEPGTTCCCRTEVDEKAPSDANARRCCCAQQSKTSDPQSKSRPSSNLSSSSPASLKSKLALHPSITIYTGRPKTRDIIRRSLEQALGESAVVVCGPQGLVSDIKRDVCSLSDERAVHKGTGAQGIYIHAESFSY
jgi:hypothetical protein